MESALAIGLNALANASRTPVDRLAVVEILTRGDGPGHLVRALFGDRSAESLYRMGMAAGLTPARVREAYETAKRRHAARNLDFDGNTADY